MKGHGNGRDEPVRPRLSGRRVSAFFSGFRGRMLDVGCPRGGLRKFLPPEAEYVGADMMAEGFPTAVRVDLNEPALPFPSATFDAVVCTATLEHVFYPLELLREMARVLKDDGRGLFSLPNDHGLSGMVSAVFYPAPSYERQVTGHHRRFDLKSARDFIGHEFIIERESRHFGPLYDRYLWFLKRGPLCTELMMFGRKRPRG